ncbi:MAG: antitoxin Xre-like helix-turn-helix domain-containing protein [Gemmatimonadaceae bacterium]
MLTPRAKPRAGRARPATWEVLLNHADPLAELYADGPMERIQLVKEGAPAELVTVIADSMGMPKEQLYKTVGVKRATVDRKLRNHTRLSANESERFVGIAQLVGQVELIVRESGATDGFNAARWVAGWLKRPLPALGGEPPATFMDTAEGRGLVADLVAQMQTGAYA